MLISLKALLHDLLACFRCVRLYFVYFSLYHVIVVVVVVMPILSRYSSTRPPLNRVHLKFLKKGGVLRTEESASIICFDEPRASLEALEPPRRAWGLLGVPRGPSCS